jgi:Arm DNA-binding domain
VIKKRGNSWWVVVYTGRDPLTGKKRQKTGTARTRAEARQLEARLIREAGTGQHRAAGNKTVAELPATVNVITEDFLEDTRAYDIEDV